MSRQIWTAVGIARLRLRTAIIPRATPMEMLSATTWPRSARMAVLFNHGPSRDSLHNKKVSDTSELFKVAAFYKFGSIYGLPALRQDLLGLGRSFGLCGSILLAPEGINGTVAGAPNALDEFMATLKQRPEFEDLEPKVSSCAFPPFQRWKVRLKKEIVTLKVASCDPAQEVGEYVPPSHWNALLEDPRVKVIDVRNGFEIEYGSFEGSINPNTPNFSSFVDFIEARGWPKDQPIAMFCTGGVRCEKASSYLIGRGYGQVKHLKGGILNYLAAVPEGQSKWRGSCFVFDDREALDHQLRPICRDRACS